MSESSQSPIRIDVESMTAYCGTGKWKIDEKGHTKEIKDKLVAIVQKYEETYKKMLSSNYIGGEAERQKAQEEQTKGILELGIIGFDYEKSANDPGIGQAALNHLAMEVYRFLAVYGGKVGMQYLQMLSTASK